MRASIAGKLLDKTRELNKQAGLPPRSDFHIVDVKPIDTHKCLALIAFDRSAGEPTAAQVCDWVDYKGQGTIHAAGASLSLHLVESAVSCIITKHAPTRPLTDAGMMRTLTANSYIDDSTNYVWQVVESGTQKFLVRNDGTDVGQVVQAMVERKNGRRDASFDIVKQAAPIVTIGDHVKFFNNGATDYGRVTAINGNNVSIACGGKTCSVDRHAIYVVVERGEGEIKSEKNQLEDYYTKAFGSPEFAQKLTDKLSKDEHNLGEGFSGGKPST